MEHTGEHRGNEGPVIGRRAALGAIGAGTVGIVAGGALGQATPGGSTQRKSKGSNVAKTPGQILTKHPFDKRDWTLTTQVRLFGIKTLLEPFDNVLTPTNIRLDAVAAVFPLIGGTSMSEAYPDLATMEFLINKRVVNDAPRIAAGYQGPTDLMVVDAQQIDSPRVSVRATVQMTSHDTRIDEDLARAVPWAPAQFQWPAVPAANLAPQLFVESDTDVVRGLAASWIRDGVGGDPRRMDPYTFAKYLAGRVVEYCQPNESYMLASSRGAIWGDPSVTYFSGFNVFGAAALAVNGIGPPLDLANLLCAVWRASGIPSRVVIAYDVGRSLELQSMIVRSWTEFCLFDPRTNEEHWIPVDVLNQRKFSSRAPKLDQTWQFFGRNEQFKFTCPVAFHWHPPTSVTNGGPPALWGWIPKPANPVADQELTMLAVGTVVKGK